MAKTIAFKDLDRFVQEHSDKIVIVDFFTQWCGPCKWQATTLKNLEASEQKKKTNGKELKIVVVKIDIDADDARAVEWNVMSIPTLMFYKGGKRQQVKDEGKRTDRLVGSRDIDELTKVLKDLRN